MKIEFLTQEDSLYILPFFEEFLRNYAGDFEITRISCCRAMGKRSRSCCRNSNGFTDCPGLGN
jgi:methionyl-tRNA formyltransferase